jgi:MFS family permease
MIVCGMWVQAIAIALVVLAPTVAFAAAERFAIWAGAAALLGLGTALVYPTLLAAIGDATHPSWRASAVGVYRLWRDLGYAVGAVIAGILADALGLSWAIGAVAGLTFLSGVVVAARMPRGSPAGPP